MITYATGGFAAQEYAQGRRAPSRASHKAHKSAADLAQPGFACRYLRFHAHDGLFLTRGPLPVGLQCPAGVKSGMSRVGTRAVGLQVS
jgi:hypothetical protein